MDFIPENGHMARFTAGRPFSYTILLQCGDFFGRMIGF
jgi:hypothetical protein